MEQFILGSTDFQKASGARLMRLLDLLDLTQVDAAVIMSTSKAQVGHWTKGRHPIPVYNLYRLIRTKNLNDVDWVLLGAWDGLPHHLARVLEAEALQAAGAATAPVGKGGETTAPASPAKKSPAKKKAKA